MGVRRWDLSCVLNLSIANDCCDTSSFRHSCSVNIVSPAMTFKPDTTLKTRGFELGAMMAQAVGRIFFAGQAGAGRTDVIGTFTCTRLVNTLKQ